MRSDSTRSNAMRIVRWDPVQELVAMRNRLNRTVNDPYTPRTEESSGAWAPPVDIFERQGQLASRTEIPGIAMKDMTFRVDNGALTPNVVRMQEPGVTA